MKLNYKLVTEILVNFIKEETEKIGLRNVVVGVSGGIDSALSALLAVKALGKDRVFGYVLPFKTSSKESVEDAYLFANHFDIKLNLIDITPFTEPFIDTLDVDSKLRKGNVMARMRMVTLFDMSSKHKAIVLGTSNKTELLLGYGTWYGDLASSINPIGDLYKTQVWDLSKYLGIPQKLIDKKPTADLWQGQTDEDELGFSYDEVDRLLYHMIDERRSVDELVKLGFNQSFISNVAERIRKNQFKRQLPVIAKISHRTIDRDFRYSRDWGY
jgi:NAD+ synthase